MGFALLVFLLLPVPHPRTVKVKAKFPVGRLSGDSPFITTFPYHHGNDNQGAKVKTILLWTQFFGSKNWATDSSTFQSCAVTTCRTTQDKGEISHADAVVMNVRDFSSLSDLPPSHPAHQVTACTGQPEVLCSHSLPATVQCSLFGNLCHLTAHFPLRSSPGPVCEKR